MNTKTKAALAFSAPLLLCANAAAAEQGFTWEGEIEIGNEQVVSSDVPANEIRNTYAIITATGTYTFGNGMAILGSMSKSSALALASVNPPPSPLVSCTRFLAPPGMTLPAFLAARSPKTMS
ncbi:hypothetical protein [Pseudophaeobacter sp.]|jgi:hypothetical protein|uniref:hypothetical protein n=1 Tax=Pseudophaeobacter sp. TaxID=1971739 RepID=UPI0032D9025E